MKDIFNKIYNKEKETLDCGILYNHKKELH